MSDVATDGDFYRELPEYPGYRFDRAGNVWSRWLRGPKPIITPDRPWRLLKLQKQGRGYLIVNLLRIGDKRHVSRVVHRMILEAFVGKRSPGKVCRHLDGDPTNNRVDNLCWGSHSENMADRDRHGNTARGEMSARAKLTTADVLAIRGLSAAGLSAPKIASRFGVSSSTVLCIVRRKSWAHVPIADQDCA